MFPTSVDYKDKRETHEELDPLHITMMMSVPGYTPFGANPAAASVLFFRELNKIVDFQKLKSQTGRLFRGSNNQKAATRHLRRHVQSTLGVDLPLEDQCVVEMMNEVRRFQWIEAERAGRDIWRERSPKDPEAGALREWFRLHFGAWYLENRKTRPARA